MCEHENADHLRPGDEFQSYARYPRRYGRFETAQCEQFRCLDCGEWLSLGEANDTPETAVELRAAHLARRDTCESEFADSEWMGWNGDEEYIMCGSLRTVWDDMSEERFAGWEAGQLAAVIAGAVDGVLPHDTDGGGE